MNLNLLSKIHTRGSLPIVSENAYLDTQGNLSRTDYDTTITLATPYRPSEPLLVNWVKLHKAISAASTKNKVPTFDSATNTFSVAGVPVPQSTAPIEEYPTPATPEPTTATFDATTLKHLALAASKDDILPLLCQIAEADGWLVATDRYRIHRHPAPDTLAGLRLPRHVVDLIPARIEQVELGLSTLRFDNVTVTFRPVEGNYPAVNRLFNNLGSTPEPLLTDEQYKIAGAMADKHAPVALNNDSAVYVNPDYIRDVLKTGATGALTNDSKPIAFTYPDGSLFEALLVPMRMPS